MRRRLAPHTLRLMQDSPPDQHWAPPAPCSLPDSMSFTAADAAFLRAMALRPSLPAHNIGCALGWLQQGCGHCSWGKAKALAWLGGSLQVYLPCVSSLVSPQA